MSTSLYIYVYVCVCTVDSPVPRTGRGGGKAREAGPETGRSEGRSLTKRQNGCEALSLIVVQALCALSKKARPPSKKARPLSLESAPFLLARSRARGPARPVGGDADGRRRSAACGGPARLDEGCRRGFAGRVGGRNQARPS